MKGRSSKFCSIKIDVEFKSPAGTPHPQPHGKSSRFCTTTRGASRLCGARKVVPFLYHHAAERPDPVAHGKSSRFCTTTPAERPDPAAHGKSSRFCTTTPRIVQTLWRTESRPVFVPPRPRSVQTLCYVECLNMGKDGEEKNERLIFSWRVLEEKRFHAKEVITRKVQARKFRVKMGWRKKGRCSRIGCLDPSLSPR
ncbi:MAG: hypothetical protein Q4C96_09435 [Planctomycetia bacterium]|nr:hypothetical protein [Planctomycetia bacterium]